MGGCLSLRRTSGVEQENRRADNLILEEFQRRLASLSSNQKQEEIFYDSPELQNLGLNSLKRRLENLEKPLEESLNDEGEFGFQDENEDQIWAETMEYRLRALACISTKSCATSDDNKTLKKKEIAQLKIAEEKQVEFEMRLSKLLKPIIN